MRPNSITLQFLSNARLSQKEHALSIRVVNVYETERLRKKVHKKRGLTAVSRERNAHDNVNHTAQPEHGVPDIACESGAGYIKTNVPGEQTCATHPRYACTKQ